MLSQLLQLNKRVLVTDDALEIAASNTYFGIQMVKALVPCWKRSDGFESILSRAARNAQGGHQIIKYLLDRQIGLITSRRFRELCSVGIRGQGDNGHAA